MENELNVTAEQEARELAGDGKMASMMSAVAILREKIQDTDQRLGEEEVSKRELSKVHDELFSEYKVNQNKLDDIHKKLADFGHDSNQLRLQLKDRLHEIEKVHSIPPSLHPSIPPSLPRSFLFSHTLIPLVCPSPSPPPSLSQREIFILEPCMC
jgi:chromosome segregation ATPase